MVKAISGVTTVRFKNELVRNITIKLGYANAKVRGAEANRYLILSHNPMFLRSSNVKTRPAQGQDATNRTRRTKKTIRHARDQDVDTA